MAAYLEYIEPLLEKIKTLIKAGERDCLKKSLALYGTDEDIESLIQLIATSSRRNTLLIVDITPFTSLGTQTRLQRLEGVYRTHPYIVLVKKGIVLEQLRTLSSVSTVVIDNNYNVVECSFVGRHKVTLEKKCIQYLRTSEDAFALHSKWVEERLYRIVPICIRRPPLGRRYTRLSDETWANQWIDIKSILKNPDMAFFIAYQLGYLLSKGYSQIPTEEVLAVGNNNAYVLASFLHQIFDEKELVMLDRLGPYPSLSRTRLLEAQRVEGKKCCVIEDVLGTGRETDLITLLIFLAKGQVEQVACLYDLQIASPLLIPEERIVSLCRPSPKIRYERRPKYEVGTATI